MDLLLAGHVHLEGQGLSSLALDVSQSILQERGYDLTDCNPRALPGKSKRNAQANAPTCPSDDGNSVFQAHTPSLNWRLRARVFPRRGA
jgi:hypothetical protein